MSKCCKWLDRDLCHSPLYIGLCTTEKSYLSELKRLGIKKNDRPSFCDLGDAVVHFVENKKGTVSEGTVSAIVCIPYGRPIHEVVGLLAHEAVHIWQEIKIKLGEHSPSPEFEAYSIQTITERLYGAYYNV